MKTKTTSKSKIERGLLVQLVSGLLASGHYTKPVEGNQGGLIQQDAGKDWEQECQPRRYQSRVMEEADNLLVEIDGYLEWKKRMEDL